MRKQQTEVVHERAGRANVGTFSLLRNDKMPRVAVARGDPKNLPTCAMCTTRGAARSSTRGWQEGGEETQTMKLLL